MGGVYKEQKELDVYPTITNPSLLTTKNSKPASRKDKKLIVLNSFTNLEKYSYIMREMRDTSTDIIVVSNELFCKDEIAKDFDKYFSRGCNIIEVTSLEPISIMQRIVYALLEKNSFVARNTDHIVFTLLSEYSQGAATIVHLLTSLIQKNEDNSRTGFELVKRQLKLHIAHQKLGRFLNSHDAKDALSSDVNENIAEPHIKHESDNCSYSTSQGLDHPGESFMPEVMSHNKKHADVSRLELYETSFSELPKVTDNNEPIGSSSCASVYIQNESYNILSPNSHDDDDHSIMIEAYKSLSTSEHDSKQIKVSKIAHGDDDIGITVESFKMPSSTSKHGSTQAKVKGSEFAHGGDVIGITPEPLKLPSLPSEHSSTQTKVDDSEIAYDVIGITAEGFIIPSSTIDNMQTKVKSSENDHVDDVISIKLEGFEISTSEHVTMQTKAKGSEIDYDDDVISITPEALRPSSTSKHVTMQMKAKGSEIDHDDDDVISITLEALRPSSTSKHSSTQVKTKDSKIDHCDDVINITQEAFKLPSLTGELSSMHTEVDDSEITHGDDVIGITAEAFKIPSSTSKNGSMQSKVKGSKNYKLTTTSDATQPLATAKPGKPNLTAVQRHPLYMYINDILSTTSNISLPAHHLLNCLTITGPIPLPFFYVEALDDVVMNAIFSKEKKRIRAESPMKQLIKEGVIRNSCYPILYHKDLDPESVDSSIKQMFIPVLICNAVKDEMDDADKALSILSVQSALKNLLTNECKPSVTHLHYLLVVCNQLHSVCSQEFKNLINCLLIT